MMNAVKPIAKTGFFLVLLVLLFLAAIPWIIQQTNNPLMPSSLASTATEYVVIKQAYDMTREQARIQATSIMIFDTPTPPYIETPTASDGDSASGVRGDILLAVWQADRQEQATAVPTMASLRAYSPDALNLYYCPNREAATNVVLDPLTEFAILGYAETQQGEVFFLIGDDLGRGQEWILFSRSLVFLGDPDYRLIFRVQTSCRLGSDSTVVAQFTPTVPLPRAITATPAFVRTTMLITNEDANTLLSNFNEEFQNPNVQFSENGMTITGDTLVNLPILGERQVPVEVTGTLEVREQKLYLNVQALIANGTDMSESEERERVEYLINNWLLNLMYGRLVQTIALADGSLTVDILQHPTPADVNTGSTTPSAPIGTPTITLTPTLPRALTATSSPNILPPGGENSTNQYSLSDLDASLQIEGLNMGWINLTVQFHSDGRIDVIGSLPIATLLGSTLSAEIVVSGHLQVRGGRLEMQADTVSVNGAPIAVSVAGRQVEDLVNSWLSRILNGQFVNSFDFQSGMLLINPP